MARLSPDSTGFTPFPDIRSAYTADARKATAPLKSMENGPGYYSAGHAGSLGLVAVDWLVERAGLTALSRFYEGIGQGATWEAAFGNVFAIGVDEFYREFEEWRAQNLQPFPKINGQVTNVDGLPFPGIHVYACQIPVGGCAHTTTNEDGRYSADVPDGDYRVQFGRVQDGTRPDGFYSIDGFTTDPGEATIITVSGEDVDGIDVQLPF